MSKEPSEETPYGSRPAPRCRDLTQKADNPYEAGQQPARGYIRLRPHRANSVLVLGVSGAIMAMAGGMMSYVCCVFAFVPLASLALSIPAWMMGQQDLAAMNAGEMDPTGRNSTMIGMVGGIAGTTLIAVGILLVAMMMVMYFIIVGVTIAL